MSTAAGRPVALVGTTASGKSSLALALARAQGGWELVSADSMQVYRGMDVGTAKPSPSERAEIPHHLIDLLDPSDEATVAWFQSEARRALEDIEGRGRRALVVGGTGLYHRAVVDDLVIPGSWPELRAELEQDPDTEAMHRRLVALDPVAAGRMEPSNRRRVIRALEVTIGSGRPFSSFGPGLETYPPSRFVLLGLDLGPDVVRDRIAERFRAQMDAGLLEEVADLRARPEGLSRTARQALGYRELLDHLEGRIALDEAIDLAIGRIRQFARRQRAWFRRDPRIRWIEVADPAEALPELLRLLDEVPHRLDGACD